MPTLPTPTTLRAIWTKSELLEEVTAVGLEGAAVAAKQPVEQLAERIAHVLGEQLLGGTRSGGSLMIRRWPSTMW